VRDHVARSCRRNDHTAAATSTITFLMAGP
jgi:hypothetical protein